MRSNKQIAALVQTALVSSTIRPAHSGWIFSKPEVITSFRIACENDRQGGKAELTSGCPSTLDSN
jgi:hypothetical protein